MKEMVFFFLIYICFVANYRIFCGRPCCSGACGVRIMMSLSSLLIKFASLQFRLEQHYTTVRALS